MGNIRVSFLLIGIASLVNSYGYKYQYNPFSKECQLMLTVPGKRDPITFYGSSTDSRYSENYGGLGSQYESSYGSIYSPSTASSSSSYYNKGLIGASAVNSQKGETSKVSGSSGYDIDYYDRRPVVSAANSKYNNYYEETAYEKELELERERERERKKIREREREREKERESEYPSGSSYEQTKKVSSSNIGLENRYPSSSSTSVSYKEPYPSSNINKHSSHSQSHGNRYQGGGGELEQAYVGSSSSSSNYNPYEEPEDVYIAKPQKNQQANNYNEESTSYGSSSGGGSSSSLGLGSSGHSGGSIGSIGTVSISSKLADYDFNEAVLLAHNNYRAKHGVKALVLDETMSYAAQRHAIKLANGAPFEHSYDAKSGKYGENIALRSGYLSPSAVTNIWYKEHLNYDYNFPELIYNSKKSNVRFTALVWRGTSKLGVGKATSSDGRTYVVANYWPPGNYESLLTENVFPPIY